MEHPRHRLSRLLLVLLGALESPHARQDLQPADLLALLAGAGFGEQDLHDLWRWLRSRGHVEAERETWLSSEVAGRAGRATLRAFGPREDELLTVPAFGYLLELVRSGQITAEQMEALIQLAQIVPETPLSRWDVAHLLEQVIAGEHARWRGAPSPAAGGVH
jgi:uncharacterized protein Smg (DUF494 family)